LRLGAEGKLRSKYAFEPAFPAGFFHSGEENLTLLGRETRKIQTPDNVLRKKAHLGAI
jgi:hypothetical protein